MHLTREVMLKNELPNLPQVFVRPTLIYGPSDPHNGYGPNRFMRLADQGEEIVLFGEGEELRDHIFIEDVAEIVRRCVVHGAMGVVNAVTGIVTSFRGIADMAAGGQTMGPRPVERHGQPLPRLIHLAVDVRGDEVRARDEHRRDDHQLGSQLGVA